MWKPTEEMLEIVSECNILGQEKLEECRKIAMLIVVDFEVAVMEEIAARNSLSKCFISKIRNQTSNFTELSKLLN